MVIDHDFHQDHEVFEGVPIGLIDAIDDTDQVSASFRMEAAITTGRIHTLW